MVMSSRWSRWRTFARRLTKTRRTRGNRPKDAHCRLSKPCIVSFVAQLLATFTQSLNTTFLSAYQTALKLTVFPWGSIYGIVCVYFDDFYFSVVVTGRYAETHLWERRCSRKRWSWWRAFKLYPKRLFLTSRPFSSTVAFPDEPYNFLNGNMRRRNKELLSKLVRQRRFAHHIIFIIAYQPTLMLHPASTV